MAGLAGTASADDRTWNGGGASDNWTDTANWVGGVSPIAGADALIFGGTTRLTPNNDTTAGSIYNGITFAAGAGSFNLGGNAMTLGGNVLNSSSSAQTISMGLTFDANRTINGGTAGIILSGPLHNAGTTGTQLLTLSGQGTLTGAVSSAGGNTNLTFDGAGTVWNWLGNASSVITGQAAFRVNNGATLNFGSATDAPSIQFGDVLESEIGFAGNGTFNMINGSILFDDRMNTRNQATFNQTGGTFEVRDQFQVSNSSLNDVATFTISGGLFDIRNNAGDGGGTFFMASRGHGTLNMNGGTFKSGTLDVSRSINNGTTGVVNLNGGVMEVNKVSTATANVNATSTANSTATFNFNGGVLKARQDHDEFLSHSEDFNAETAAHINVPLNVNVQTGGAIIDNGGFAISALVPIKHDAALGATPDGGLTSNGIGTLTLAADNTYTGGTTVNGGTLQVGNFDINVAGSGLAGSVGTGNVTLNAATLNFNRAGTATVSGNITGTGTGFQATVGHFGPGTVILNGANTYTGATDVTGGGTLIVNGSTASGEAINVTGMIGGTGSTGNVTITSGVANGVRPGATPDDGDVGTLTMNSLNITQGDFRMDLVGVGTSDQVVVTNGATFAAGGNSTFTAAFASAPAAGTYTLLDAGSPIVYDHTPTLVAPTGTRTTLTLDTTTEADKVLLNIAGSAANLVWTGGNDTTTWNKTILNNWSGHADNKFYNGDSVTFNESANANVTVAEAVDPSSVTFNNNTTNYTLSGPGSIGGQFTTLTKNGTGTLTIQNANTYGGGTVVNAGTVILQNANALGAPTAAVTLNGTSSLNLNTSVTLGAIAGASGTTITTGVGGEQRLTVAAQTDSTFGGVINNGSGTIAVTKNGPGALVLSNNNTYTGETRINGGTVQIGTGGTSGSLLSTVITSDDASHTGQMFVINRSDNITFSPTTFNAGLGFRKMGTNTVTLGVDAGYTGPTIIDGGSLVIGTGGGTGSIGTGPVTNNGSLVINRTGSVTLQGAISGTGSLTQNLAALTTINGTNSYTGTTTINAGTVAVGTHAAFGAQGTAAAPGASVTIANGAVLDITNAPGGGGFGPKEFFVAGSGPSGGGVITSGGANQNNAFQRITLTGNATFGSTGTAPTNGRYDIRAGQVGGVNFAKLNLNGNTLTKEGANQFSLVAVDVNPGNIVVNGGIFAAETTTNLSNDPSSLITMNNGTTIQFFNVSAATGAINRKIRVNGSVTTGTASGGTQSANIGSAWELNGDLTIGIVNNGTGQTFLNGNISEVGGPRSITKTGVTTGNVAPTATLNGALGWTGNTTVNAGELVLGGTSNLLTGGDITIAATAPQPAGRLTMTANGNRTLKGKSLSIAAGAVLNLNDNDLLVDYGALDPSPEGTIRQYVRDGRNIALTSGIKSTPGATADDVVLAVADNAEWGKTVFNGVNIDASTIVGKYTYFGDSNLDGQVTGDDYLAVDSNLGTGNSWNEGDFNMDNSVTGDDYLAIDTNLGKGTLNPLAFAELKAEMVAKHVAMFGEGYLVKLAEVEANGITVVPEPGALSLIGLGAIGLLGRRRRRA